MKEIKNILEKDGVSYDELIGCFELIKSRGDVVAIKLDGERTDNQYTVFIIFPNDKAKEMIREDKSDLKEALINVLARYVKNVE